MCTDEQWLPRSPTGVMMISKNWIPTKDQSLFNRFKNGFSYWLTPLDVPVDEMGYKFSFPRPSSVCVSHMPCKLK